MHTIVQPWQVSPRQYRSYRALSDRNRQPWPGRGTVIINYRGQTGDINMTNLEMMIKKDISGSKIPVDQIVALQVRHPFNDFFTPHNEAVQ